MFIVNLNYKKDMEEVDKVLPYHIEFLEKYYSKNKFICSGRKNPRTGGIIIINSNDKNEVQKIISEDPFNINKVAEYEVIEFMHTKYAEKFSAFLK